MSSALRNTLAGVVIAGALFPAVASAQDAKNQGYLLDSQGNIVRAIGAGVCVRTSDWTPARAVAECDPDLVKKPAPPKKVAPPPKKKVEKKAPPKKKKPVMLNITEKIELQGMPFDKAGNLYFIDELNGGSLYKYTPKASLGAVKAGLADYFAAGQSFVLRVGNGNTPNATGAFTWVPFTNANGAGLPGAITITDSNGVTSVDARNTTDLAAFKGTDYQRPEDMQLQTAKGREYLYVTTTTTHETYRLDLKNQTIATPMPFHAGAKKYMEEKGVKVQ